MGESWSEFRPPWGLRSSHLQSLLNSSGIRRQVVLRRSASLREAGRVWTLDGGDGIRLQGLYSKQADRSRGLAVLLHGWEGSVNSNYVLANSARLFDAGFDVFQDRIIAKCLTVGRQLAIGASCLVGH